MACSMCRAGPSCSGAASCLQLKHALNTAHATSMPQTTPIRCAVLKEYSPSSADMLPPHRSHHHRQLMLVESGRASEAKELLETRMAELPHPSYHSAIQEDAGASFVIGHANASTSTHVPAAEGGAGTGAGAGAGATSAVANTASYGTVADASSSAPASGSPFGAVLGHYAASAGDAATTAMQQPHPALQEQQQQGQGQGQHEQEERQQQQGQGQEQHGQEERQQQEVVAVCRCYVLDVLCDGLAAYDTAAEWLLQQQQQQHHQGQQQGHDPPHHHHHHHHHHHNHDHNHNHNHDDTQKAHGRHTASGSGGDTPSSGHRGSGANHASSSGLDRRTSLNFKPQLPLGLPPKEIEVLLQQVKTRAALHLQTHPHQSNVLGPHGSGIGAAAAKAGAAGAATSPTSSRLLPSTPSRSEQPRNGGVLGLGSFEERGAAAAAAVASGQATLDDVFTMTGELNDPDEGFGVQGAAAADGAAAAGGQVQRRGVAARRPTVTVQPLLPSLLSSLAGGSKAAAKGAAQGVTQWLHRCLAAITPAAPPLAAVGGASAAPSSPAVAWLLHRGGWQALAAALAAALMAFALVAESRAAAQAVALRWRRFREAVRSSLAELLSMGLALTPR